MELHSLSLKSLDALRKQSNTCYQKTDQMSFITRSGFYLPKPPNPSLSSYGLEVKQKSLKCDTFPSAGSKTASLLLCFLSSKKKIGTSTCFLSKNDTEDQCPASNWKQKSRLGSKKRKYCGQKRRGNNSKGMGK